jgi:hypothetical protein
MMTRTSSRSGAMRVQIRLDAHAPPSVKLILALVLELVLEVTVSLRCPIVLAYTHRPLVTSFTLDEVVSVQKQRATRTRPASLRAV